MKCNFFRSSLTCSVTDTSRRCFINYALCQLAHAALIFSPLLHMPRFPLCLFANFTRCLTKESTNNQAAVNNLKLSSVSGAALSNNSYQNLISCMQCLPLCMWVWVCVRVYLTLASFCIWLPFCAGKGVCKRHKHIFVISLPDMLLLGTDKHMHTLVISRLITSTICLV